MSNSVTSQAGVAGVAVPSAAAAANLVNIYQNISLLRVPGYVVCMCCLIIDVLVSLVLSFDCC